MEEQDYYGGKDKILEKQEQVKLANASVDKVTFDDNYLLDTDESSADEDELREFSKMYMPEEEQGKIEESIIQVKTAEVVESTDCWNQDFFRRGTKSIRQPGLISREVGIGNKEIHISELSASTYTLKCTETLV